MLYNPQLDRCSLARCSRYNLKCFSTCTRDRYREHLQWHYSDIIMDTIASQITSLNRLFRRKSKKTSKLRVTGLCVGNSLVIDEFPAQVASNAENVSIWWRHHEMVQVNATRPPWWVVRLGSCNGLVLSGNKTLPEPVLTQIFVVIWPSWAIMIWLKLIIVCLPLASNEMSTVKYFGGSIMRVNSETIVFDMPPWSEGDGGIDLIIIGWMILWSFAD